VNQLNGRAEERVVLITGAARGLGHEVARQLADVGATVLIAARDVAAAQAAALALSDAGDVRALPVGLDITDEGSVDAAVAAVQRNPGGLDVLINNAAVYPDDWVLTATATAIDEVDRLMRTNLYGAWRTTKAFLPLLASSSHPRIVNVSSSHGSHEDRDFGMHLHAGQAASYSVSKAALNALTHILGLELAGTHVIVNGADPGLTDSTPAGKAMGGRPIAEGAASIVWAATLPDDGPRGGLFRDGQPIPW
jgi:NAD(P)-dependent dehydrogenase (short-subunit alcohol dehydrogenase family)